MKCDGLILVLGIKYKHALEGEEIRARNFATSPLRGICFSVFYLLLFAYFIYVSTLLLSVFPHDYPESRFRCHAF